MNKTITIKCPFCNKSTSIEIGDKNIETEESPVLVKDISTLTGGNANPEFTLISFTKCGHNFIVHNKKLIPFSNEHLNKNEEFYITNGHGHNLTTDDADNLLLAIGAYQDKLNPNYAIEHQKNSERSVLSIVSMDTKYNHFLMQCISR